jgi:hypothetical protein
MGLDKRYDMLRYAINECVGYRILDDDDVLQPGDETVCGSMILSQFYEGWHEMGPDDEDWREFFGRTVRDMNDRKHNNEMDTEERMFRRKVTPNPTAEAGKRREE